jgi:hypothetical protein
VKVAVVEGRQNQGARSVYFFTPRCLKDFLIGTAFQYPSVPDKEGLAKFPLPKPDFGVMDHTQ